MPSPLELVMYTTPAGNCQVSDFLAGLDPIPREMGFELISELLEGTIRDKPKSTAHLDGPIWELRWSFQKRIYRLTYVAEDGKAVLLHGFEKKTQKTPQNIITQSKKRHIDWRKGNVPKK